PAVRTDGRRAPRCESGGGVELHPSNPRRSPEAMSPNPANALLVPAHDLPATPTAPAHILDPVTRGFIDGLTGSPPIYTLSPSAARALLSGAQKSAEVPLPEVSSEDRVLMVGPEGRTRICVVRPAGATGPLPVIVYIHGGGWVIGDNET